MINKVKVKSLGHSSILSFPRTAFTSEKDSSPAIFFSPPPNFWTISLSFSLSPTPEAYSGWYSPPPIFYPALTRGPSKEPLPYSFNLYPNGPRKHKPLLPLSDSPVAEFPTPLFFSDVASSPVAVPLPPRGEKQIQDPPFHMFNRLTAFSLRCLLYLDRVRTGYPIICFFFFYCAWPMDGMSFSSPLPLAPCILGLVFQKRLRPGTFFAFKPWHSTSSSSDFGSFLIEGLLRPQALNAAVPFVLPNE